jgi:hypothetical protein
MHAMQVHFPPVWLLLLRPLRCPSFASARGKNIARGQWHERSDIKESNPFVFCNLFYALLMYMYNPGLTFTSTVRWLYLTFATNPAAFDGDMAMKNALLSLVGMKRQAGSLSPHSAPWLAQAMNAC